MANTCLQPNQSYPPAFARAVARLLGDESDGCVRNPADAGGETDGGIGTREHLAVDSGALSREPGLGGDGAVTRGAGLGRDEGLKGEAGLTGDGGLGSDPAAFAREAGLTGDGVMGGDGVAHTRDAGLTRDDTIAIYFREWWRRYNYSDLPGAIGAKVFALAVRIGPAEAARCLQRALRACGRAVPEDGVIGAGTRVAAMAANQLALMAALRSEAAACYRLLAAIEDESRRDELLHGWLSHAYE